MAQRVIDVARRSLIWQIITPILIVLTLLIAGVMSYLPSTIKEYAIHQAKHKAEETAEQFKLLRGYYAEHVIAEVLSESNLKVDVIHNEVGVIPLPATMIHDLSEIFSKKGTFLKLYSPYPFPNRNKRELDNFALDAWKHLRAKPNSNYTRVITTSEGNTFVRVAVADKLISSTCVDCHNNHPLSPKTDWQLDEIRGVLEVDTKIDEAIIKGYNLGVELSLIVSIAFVLIILLIFYLHNALILTPIKTLAYRMGSLINKDSNVGDRQPPISRGKSLNKEDTNEIEYLYNAFSDQQRRLEERESSILGYQATLENQVRARTQALEEKNTELSVAQTQLKAANKEIIQSEKLTALGNMVSSISHEISTPIGVANTAAGYLNDETKQIREKFNTNLMKHSDLESYLIDNQEAGDLVQKNLRRAAELMRAFKVVAVDQISEQSRSIDLRYYIDEVLLSLKPSYKNSKVVIENSIDTNLTLNIEAGTLAQIITNLITNSMIHGFDEGNKAGKISISSEKTEEHFTLIYQDNGQGIALEALPHVFDQFYTTRKDKGGSGLGMFIIHELVTDRLNGSLTLTSPPQGGIILRITLPC